MTLLGTRPWGPVPRTFGLVRNLVANHNEMLVLHAFPVLEDLEKSYTSAWVMLNLALENNGRFLEEIHSEAYRTTFQTMSGKTYVF